MTEVPRIVAPEGSALHAALIGVEDLQRSLDFYCGRLGLQVLVRRPFGSDALQTLWQLPPGPDAEVVVLAERGCLTGRIVLFDFGRRRGPRIRTVKGQRFYGLVNLNFYSNSISARTRELAAAGYEAWTPPIQHAMDAAVGAPTEVMIDGPDGIIVNLVELTEGAPGSRIAHMRTYVRDEFGYNAAGFTPVVTTQHCVPDLERSMRFYREALGMGVLIDAELHRDELNDFMQYPRGSRTRSVFMQGNHMFGKVALNHPLDQTFIDLAPVAKPPRSGYFALSFRVRDLRAALAAARATGAATFSEPIELDYPGLGPTRAAVVRNPGGGALQELVEWPQ